MRQHLLAGLGRGFGGLLIIIAEVEAALLEQARSLIYPSGTVARDSFQNNGC